MVKRPEQFQVIVTANMFGDIVTDLGGQLQGGLGVAASGNLNPGKVSMFEPVHGSAPKYQGKNIANPIAAILSAQLLLEYLGFMEEGNLIENAVISAIRTDNTTKDLGGKLGTKEVGDFICHEIMKNFS
jgi:3-isopropylmalate dehydrogenase